MKFCRLVMKSLSECGIRMDDYRFVEMCEEYRRMVDSGQKKEYVIAVLTERYGISESSLRRVMRRLWRSVRT